MKYTIPLAGALLLGGLLSAQDQDQDSQPPQDAKAQYAALMGKIQQAQKDHLLDMRKQAAEAKKAGNRRAMRSFSMRPDMKPFIPEFQAAAIKYQGTDDAVQFLFWLVRASGDQPAARTALATLGEKHASSPALAGFGGFFGQLPRAVGKPAAEGFLAAVRLGNTDPDVQGHLALNEFGGTIDSAELDSDQYKQARATLTGAIAKATDSSLKTTIKARIDLRERLSTGATAPDIEGIDINGVAFKLSDYKGKIIFLDFWGDW